MASNSRNVQEGQRVTESLGDQSDKAQDKAAVDQLQQEQTSSTLQVANEQNAASTKSFESSFSFTPPTIPSHVTEHDYIVDLTKYIPVGCLRIRKNEFAKSLATWKCESWKVFAHPRDIYNGNAGPALPYTLQENILDTALYSYRNLHMAGWIRMEFKTQGNLGQVRVYVLPDDVGRASIDRDSPSLCKSMQTLLAHLDISRLTWNGLWTEKLPVHHTWSPLSPGADDKASLFHLFNTLPSPNPMPEVVTNRHAREGMEGLLASNLWGLKTNLYNYQRRTAALMLQREAQPAIFIDPRLKHVMDQNSNTWYYDETIGVCLQTPRTYESAQGGICAETMGLGKTLICLSLILATRDHPSRIPAEYSVGTIPVRKKAGTLVEMVASATGRLSVPWKDFFANKADDGEEMSECTKALREAPGHYFIPPLVARKSTRSLIDPAPRKIWLTCATIVVVPSNLIQQWAQEIEKHTVGLEVLIVKNGKEPLPPAKEMAEFDIILFTKPRFDQESQAGKPSPDGGNNSDDGRYRSPLKDLHFKRLITDEGHNFGNASRSQKTEAMVVVDGLNLDARWIVSGTPTHGLYGAEVGSISSSTPSALASTAKKGGSGGGATLEDLREVERLLHQQERKDLEKLGNIATTYLKMRPWDGKRGASWAHYVMQPQHGLNSRGSIDCLRATMESMIIRHRSEDVEQDVILPPLKHDTVYLEGSIQDKISLNMFFTLITANAVTSERRDADYFFNRGNKDALNNLFSNMREASLFWSSKDILEAKETLRISQKFLEDFCPGIPMEDQRLLERSIKAHESLISNETARVITRFHEMPIFVQNEFSEDIRLALSLDGTGKSPTMMGATMLHAAQNFVDSQIHKEDPTEGLIGESLRIRDRMSIAQQHISSSPSTKRKNISSVLGKAASSSPSSKKQKSSGKATVKLMTGAEKKEATQVGWKPQVPEETPTAHLKILGRRKTVHAKIVSTASTKLTYLIDKISSNQDSEKILVFYESDNTAYYIAQALECIGVKHLIYAKSLDAQRRAQYVVTFNQTDVFRVLLMDVSQAAFGLDISSASRVYFVNPVFSPQIEAQAVKRAHRIGQNKPVFVETLVLKGSIEETMMRRRAEMTTEQHTKCKSLLDDEVMYDWVRNIDAKRFFDIEDVSEPEQMALLKVPQRMFGRGVEGGQPDEDLAHYTRLKRDKLRERDLKLGVPFID